MTSWRIIVALFAAAAGTFMPIAAANASPSRAIAAGQSFALSSKVLGDVREINIWAPAEEEKLPADYTLVYLIDGGTEQDYFHIMGLAQLGTLSGTFGPIVLVGIETKDRRAELTSAPLDDRFRREFPESGKQAEFRRFLAEEVKPFVEAKYPRHGRSALMGESLAGLFVIDSFLFHPASFDDYVSVSPSLWWDKKRLARTGPSALATGNHADKRLYFSIADEGGAMKAAFDALADALRQNLPAESLKIVDRSADMSHATIYHSSAEQAFRWLFAQPPYDYGPAPWYMVDEREPSQ